MRKKLGVNIDHVATIRNARNESYPNPVDAALLCEKSGADSITIHLREDRRHIRDIDLIKIKKKIKIPLNLEMAPTKEMLSIALKYKPNFVCLVPEKRKEVTTEGGLNLKKNKKHLFHMIKKLKKNKIRVSLFINPSINDVKISKELNDDCIEIHTGKYCRLLNMSKKTDIEFAKLKKTAFFANKNDLEVHAGHGLTYMSALNISKIKTILEFNIGHFIISESIFWSLPEVIKKFRKIINK